MAGQGEELTEDQIESLRVVDLRQALKQRSLPTTGKKVEMQQRLREALQGEAQESEEAQNPPVSADGAAAAHDSPADAPAEADDVLGTGVGANTQHEDEEEQKNADATEQDANAQEDANADAQHTTDAQEEKEGGEREEKEEEKVKEEEEMQKQQQQQDPPSHPDEAPVPANHPQNAQPTDSGCVQEHANHEIDEGNEPSQNFQHPTKEAQRENNEQGNDSRRLHEQSGVATATQASDDAKEVQQKQAEDKSDEQDKYDDEEQHTERVDFSKRKEHRSDDRKERHSDQQSEKRRRRDERDEHPSGRKRSHDEKREEDTLAEAEERRAKAARSEGAAKREWTEDMLHIGEERTSALRIDNFERPLTEARVIRLLRNYGNITEGNMAMPKVKDHCYVIFDSADAAYQCAKAVDGMKGPSDAATKRLKVKPVSRDEAKRAIAELTSTGGREKKRERKDQEQAKSIDELFRKTRAKPPLYWLPRN